MAAREIWQRALDRVSVPGDTEELRLQKRLQTTMAAVSLVAVGGWGASFLAFARTDAALFAFGYCAATAAMLAQLLLTRRYAWFRAPHTALVLLAPATLHVYLGGFSGSGGAVLWSLLGPVGAMMFVGTRAALVWLAALCAILVGGAVLEATPRATALTPAQASFYFAFNGCGLATFVFFSTRHFIARIGHEKERSERLLLNVLPRAIAERLKREPGLVADRFDGVTVLFSDLVGFTALSERMTPGALVELLNEVFSAFDRLADSLGVEKIKTIGDAYMVVGGLPDPMPDHAERVARMAIAMRTEVARVAARRGVALDMRIGIHSGECVAGVIGLAKFSYDLWGDTVNTASRMESHGAPGRIHISEATRTALAGRFATEPRGRIAVKGKGELETYWLEA